MLLMVVKEYLGEKKNFENIMDFIFIFSNFRNKVMREKKQQQQQQQNTSV